MSVKIINAGVELQFKFVNVLFPLFSVFGLRNVQVLKSCVIVLHISVIVMIVLYSVFHINFRTGDFRFV